MRRADAALLARCVVAADYSDMRTESRARRVVAELPDFSGASVLAVDDTVPHHQLMVSLDFGDVTELLQLAIFGRESDVCKVDGLADR